MNITLLYFDGCPNWTVADERLREALIRTGNTDVEVTYREIPSLEEAQAVEFHGWPTILIDGHDPFLDQGSPVALCCRVYRSETGLIGAPTVEQLVGVLR